MARYHPPLTADPDRHIAYAKSNRVTASLWLFALIVALYVFRSKALPNGSQAATLFGAAVVVVVSASFAPEVVTWILAALLVASVLTNVPVVSGILASVQARIAALVPGMPL